MVTSADPESLVLALEPEAAAVTVAASAPQRQQLSTVTARGPQKKRPQELEAGDVVMVVDCGGGTADVTLHEVVVDTEGRAGGGGRAAAAAAEGVHLLEAAVGKGKCVAKAACARGAVGSLRTESRRKSYNGADRTLQARLTCHFHTIL